MDYLLLPEGREQAFIEHARRIAAARFPNLLNGDYTAIIDQRQYDRLQAMLQDAQAQGATLIPLLPGQAGDAARRILPPVLVLNATPAMQVLQREIFGPILPILTYRSHEEVVQYINARQHPLALYIYSHDKAGYRLPAPHPLGRCQHRRRLIHTGLHNLPFGGVGHSGIGHYHGYEGFLTFSKLRPVFQQSRWRTVDLLMPPYGKRAYQLLKFMFWRNRSARAARWGCRRWPRPSNARFRLKIGPFVQLPRKPSPCLFLPAPTTRRKRPTSLNS